LEKCFAAAGDFSVVSSARDKADVPHGNRTNSRTSHRRCVDDGGGWSGGAVMSKLFYPGFFAVQTFPHRNKHQRGAITKQKKQGPLPETIPERPLFVKAL
jgi:hypothetical protein